MTVEYRHALPTGMRIGECRIEAVLGAGGFGITYLAVDENLGTRVAVKEYLPVDLAVRAPDMSVQARSSGSDATFAWGLERFRDEAQMLARFDHPNIVRVLRYLEANHTAYMVMQYVDGESLRDRLVRRGRLPEDEVTALLAALLDGLALVHRAGVLHRDIKPANIYVRADGSPVLLDFGAARQAMGERSHSMTTVLTPPYAPFEQYGKTLPQGPWTDIYAVAAVLYETLSGGHKPPDATDRVMTDPLVPLSQFIRVAPGLEETVAAGLRVDGAKRPQSVEAWRALLPHGQGPVAIAVAIPEPQEQAVNDTIPAAHWGRAVAMAAALVVTFACVGGGIFYIRDKQGEPRPAAEDRRPTETGLTGTWRGTGHQTPQGGSNSDYPIVMTMISDAGAIDYPSLGCGGSLARISGNDMSARYHESITYGKCIDGGAISVKLSQGHLTWAWDGKAGGAQYHVDAVLER